MALTDAGKNLMLNGSGFAANGLYAGLLDDSNVELTGGSPAYARIAITWNAAASGSMTADIAGHPIVFNVPAGKTVSQLIIMSALTVGTEYARYDATNEVFAGQGTCTIPSITVSI